MTVVRTRHPISKGTLFTTLSPPLLGGIWQVLPALTFIRPVRIYLVSAYQILDTEGTSVNKRDKSPCLQYSSLLGGGRQTIDRSIYELSGGEML